MVKRTLIDMTEEEATAVWPTKRLKHRVTKKDEENAPALLQTIDQKDGKLHRIVIQPNKPVLIGRSSLCHYVIDSPLVSAEHCKIYAVQHDTYLTVCCKDLSTNGVKLNNMKMQPRSAVLLAHGDDLTLPNNQAFHVVYKAPLPLKPDNLHGLSLTPQRSGNVAVGKGRYIISSVELGNGTFGSVHLAIDVVKGRQVACKIISIKDVGQGDVKSSEKYQMIMREVSILKRLSHSNINKILEVCKTECEKKICVILSLSTGGDLFSHLVRRHILNEMEAKYFLLQILYGIKYLHDNSIAHRDIKPENILLLTPPPFPRLQIADFGLARVFPRDKKAKANKRALTVLGTVDYVAPEVAELMSEGRERMQTSAERIAMAGDAWAIGCIGYQMLTGLQPFYPYDYVEGPQQGHEEEPMQSQLYDVPPAPESLHNNSGPEPGQRVNTIQAKPAVENSRDELVRRNIMECKPDWSHSIWSNQPQAKWMIEGLLEKNTAQRWTAKQALDCHWMQEKRDEMEEMYQRTLSVAD